MSPPAPFTFGELNGAEKEDVNVDGPHSVLNLGACVKHRRLSAIFDESSGAAEAEEYCHGPVVHTDTETLPGHDLINRLEHETPVKRGVILTSCRQGKHEAMPQCPRKLTCVSFARGRER